MGYKNLILFVFKSQLILVNLFALSFAAFGVICLYLWEDNSFKNEIGTSPLSPEIKHQSKVISKVLGLLFSCRKENSNVYC